MYFIFILKKEEFKVLAEKETVLKEREGILIAARMNWDKTVDVEVQQKLQRIQQVSCYTMKGKISYTRPLVNSDESSML